MRLFLCFIVALIATGVTANTQEKHSPYKGDEKREIKALSEQDVHAYLEGQGMGLAKAAELNQYPGPKHVLEFASELKLSDKQAAETKASFERMRREAVRIGASIVEKEKYLDRLFAEKQIDSSKLQTMTGEIGKLQGELRFVHLKAHLEMRGILTEEQVKKYDELRGYNNSSHSHHDQKKHR